MSVEIRNGLGQNFCCKNCGEHLILSSKDNYKGCDNCGFINDLSPKFQWYDNFYIWVLGFAYISIIAYVIFK